MILKFVIIFVILSLVISWIIIDNANPKFKYKNYKRISDNIIEDYDTGIRYLMEEIKDGPNASEVKIEVMEDGDGNYIPKKYIKRIYNGN